MNCDNQSAVASTQSKKFNARSKHIDIRYHFIKESIKNNEVKMNWVPTSEQLADILTKPLGPTLFKKFRDAIVLKGVC